MTELPDRSGRSGFTLIEIMVAVVIAMMGILLIRAVFVAATVTGERAEAAVERANTRENADDWLASSFLSLDPNGPGGFKGDRYSVAFTSWLETPDGWFEREPIQLAFEEGQLTAHAGTAALVLQQELYRAEFDYLLEPGADTRWVAGWSSPVSAPLAVRLRTYRIGPEGAITGDTVLFLIGQRG